MLGRDPLPRVRKCDWEELLVSCAIARVCSEATLVPGSEARMSLAVQLKESQLSAGLGLCALKHLQPHRALQQDVLHQPLGHCRGIEELQEFLEGLRLWLGSAGAGQERACEPGLGGWRFPVGTRTQAVGGGKRVRVGCKYFSQSGDDARGKRRTQEILVFSSPRSLGAHGWGLLLSVGQVGGFGDRRPDWNQAAGSKS